MDKMHDLLRLIVQKMEIRSESDERDVGACATPTDGGIKSFAFGRHSAEMNLVRQATVINRWKKKSAIE